MRRAWGLAPLTALLMLFALSCSDLSVFGPQGSTAASIEVRSLREGQLLASGESVTFILHAEKQAGAELSLEVTLIDAAGEGVWSNTLAGPTPEEPLELKLPALATGQYRLKLVLTRPAGPAVEKQVTFFYVTGSYAINGITSFPPTIQPDSRTLLRADLSFPEGADPYVRWTQDGQVLGRGRVSEGLGQVSWQAPKTEGVYPIQVELFPAAPVTGEDFPFSSSLVLSAKLYVAPAAGPPSDELSPRESYLALFHLDGSLTDSAPSDGPTAAAFGTATPEGVRGYRLTPGSGIRYPRLVLPVSDGQLAPCTITLVLSLEDRNAGAELLAIRAEAFLLRLNLDAEGRPQGLLRWEEGEVRLPSGLPALSAGTPHRLDVSLVPEPKALTVLWFLDGLPASAATYRLGPLSLAPTGEMVIGGEKGFQGTIAEFGVYFQDEQKRPSVDPNIYRSVQERVLRNRLILAEGFDGFYLPDGFVASPEGSARLAGGRLALDPAASLDLPFFDLSAGAETVVEIAFAVPLPAGASASLTWEGEGKAILDILPEGKLVAPGTKELASFPPLTDALQLVLGSDRLTLKAPSGPVELALPSPSGRERWLKLGLRSPPLETGLSVDRVLVYLKNPQ